MSKKRSKIYRDHVIQKQFKDILLPIFFNRNVAVDTAYLKFMTDNLSKEVTVLQPKELKKTKILGDFVSGIWIKTNYPSIENSEYKDSNLNIEIKGHVRYQDKIYSLFSQIIFPLGYYKSNNKIKPVSSIISEDVKKLLDSFNAKYIKIDGINYIQILFKNANEDMNTTKDVIYEVLSNDELFSPCDLPSGSQDLIFESGWIKFGSISEHDPIEDADRLVRSDKIKELIVLTQENYDEMVNNDQTKESELYFIEENYIENPTLPPTEQPIPDKVSLAVKFNDSYIWTRDYDINSIVNEDDIDLPKINGWIFKKFKTKPLDDPTTEDVVFPLILTESVVIYGEYEEVSRVKGIVWENSYKLLEEDLQTGDSWDPRSKIADRKDYYYKLYAESDLINLAQFPILVVNSNIEIWSKWTYGYYFPTEEDFNNRIDDIIADKNGDLGDLTFEFGDEVDVLDYLFYRKPITSTPRTIISKATSCRYTFSECNQLTEVSDTVYSNCPNLANFEGSFKDSSKIIGDLPDLWNRFTDATGTDCFTGCTKADNYLDVPLEWGGMLYHTIRVLNYEDDSLVRTLKLLDQTTYDFMTISETYDSTGVWGAFFLDKNRTQRIYDPIQIVENKDYYAEFDKFDYYFTTIEDFKTRIQSISDENNGNLSEKSIGFAPSVNMINTSVDVLNLKSLPKYIWNNINRNNSDKVLGLQWNSNTLNTVPESYFYFMTRMKKINGMFKSKYSESSENNLISENLLQHQIHLLSITNLFDLNLEIDIKSITDLSKMNIPDNFLQFNTELNYIDGLFKGVPAQTIPVTLFRNNTSLQVIKNTFRDNKALTAIPSTLFDPLSQLQDLSYTFAYCQNVEGLAPKLWERDPAIPIGTDCFKECKKLTNFFEIPKEWGGEPPTEKEVVVRYKSNITGGYLSGTDVTESNPSNLDVTIIAQLSDNSAILPDIVANYGKSEFLGWSTSQENKDVLYQSGDTITIPETEITLYAWYEKSLTVTYNANTNGSFSSGQIATQAITQNPNISNSFSLSPSELTPNDGFSFKEWNTASSGSGTGYSLNDTVENMGTLSNFTLYAIYNDVRQSVTFRADTNITIDGYSPNTEVTIKLPKPFTIPTISVANKVMNENQLSYDFFAQTNSGNIPQNKYQTGSIIPESITEVYAWYKMDALNLTLNVNYSGGSNGQVVWSEVYSNNDSTTNRQITFTPQRSYYIFKGWSTFASGQPEYQSNENITSVLSKFKNNQTLYAIWEGEPVTVNYNLDGGTIDGSSTLTVQAKVGDTIQIVNKTPVKEGYTFTNFSDKTGKTYNPGDSFIVTPETLS